MVILWGVWIIANMIAVPWLIGYSILNPFQQAMRTVKAPTQFLLTDFIWLVAQFQIVLAFVAGYVPGEERASFVILLTYLLVAATVLWAAAVSVLSKAGVRGSVRRGLFVFLLPLILALMIGSAAFFSSAPFWLSYLLHLPGYGPVMTTALAVVVVGGGTGALFLVCWLLRRITVWIVAGVVPQAV
jgi:hypothetical protein